nr:unnamed protein product [Digitaria exilis]
MDDIAEMLVRGINFYTTDETVLTLTKSAFTNLPYPPAAKAAPPSGAVLARAPDGVDRISRLPAEILRNIVSRLPVKDAARTILLSTRWRRVWHTTPLVLVDAHLLPRAGATATIRRASTSSARLGAVPREVAPRGLADAVSSALAAHPAPSRQGLQELFFINRIRTFDADVLLPAMIFRCTSLIKLYIGFWRFPETAPLPRTAGFPHLRELGLCSLVMKERDLEFVLDRCPVLEKLLIIGSRWPVCLRVRSHSLLCVEVCECIASEITVVHASHLERLFLWEASGGGSLTNMPSKIKIGHAPKLRFLGFLVPGMHQLEIGNIVIKSENDDIKFCGPRLTATSKHNLKCWNEAGQIQCIQQHIKKVVIREFRGTRSELEFLKFIAEHAQVLEKMPWIFPFKFCGYQSED